MGTKLLSKDKIRDLGKNRGKGEINQSERCMEKLYKAQ